MTARGPGYSSLNICVAWSPDGQQIATGGDNSQVTLWDGNANPCRILTGQSINLHSSDNFQITCVIDEKPQKRNLDY